MADVGRTIGFGTTVKISTSSTAATSAAAATIGALIDIGGFTNAVPSIDVTLIDDAAACTEPGTPTAGPGTITVGYKQIDTGSQRAIAQNAARTKTKLWIVYTSTSLSDESMKCFISDAGVETIAKDSQLRRTFSVQPTSAIGWT